MKTLLWVSLLWSVPGDRICAHRICAQDSVFSSLSQPFSQWIGLCLKLDTFISFLFPQLKGTREESKSRKQQRRFEGQGQETVALTITSQRRYMKPVDVGPALCFIFVVLKEEVLIHTCFVSFAEMIWVNGKEIDKESPMVQMKRVGGCMPGRKHRCPRPRGQKSAEAACQDFTASTKSGYCVTNQNCLSLPDCISTWWVLCLHVSSGGMCKYGSAKMFRTSK